MLRVRMWRCPGPRTRVRSSKQVDACRPPASSDISRDLTLENDCPDDVGWIAADLSPMGEEGVVVPGREGSHSRGLRVALMRKEDRQISVDNLAQDYTA